MRLAYEAIGLSRKGRADSPTVALCLGDRFHWEKEPARNMQQIPTRKHPKPEVP